MAQQFFEQVATAIELPDAVMYGVAKYAGLAFAPAYEPFAQALRTYAPAQLAAVASFLDAQGAAQNPFRARLPMLQIEQLLFAIVMYFATLLVLHLVCSRTGAWRINGAANIHNAFLTLVSGYMAVGIVATAVASGGSLWNNAFDPANKFAWSAAKMQWLFYASKFPEFIDTFIMVIKQNYRQVSFLHLYHHATIPFVWFCVCSIAPGGDAYWSSCLNVIVHVFMYSYYFGAAFAGKTGPIRTFLNSIKFIITKGQMTQFSLNVVQAIVTLYVVPTTRYVPFLIKLMLVYMLTLLALFGNFLIRNMGKKGGDDDGAEGGDVKPRKSKKE